LTVIESAKISSNYNKAPTTLNEASREDEITEFVSDPEEIVKAVLNQLNGAQEELLGIGSKDAPNLIFKFKPYTEAVLHASRSIKLPGRYITDITISNLQSCKALMHDFHVNVRHLKDIRSNLIITEKEFTSDLSPSHPDGPSTKILFSDSKQLLTQQKQLFETLWSISVPAEQRIKEIEEGIETEETKLLNDSAEVFEESLRVAQGTKSEVSLLLPGLERMELSQEIFLIFAEKALKEKIRVRILAPLPKDLQVGQKIIERFSMFEIKTNEPIQIGLMISDKRKMVFVQYLDIMSKDKRAAIVSGIYSTHGETISSVSSIFETMWMSSEVREKEVKSRRQAELLQDILTHDIRNYNQVSRLSAELLKEELKDNIAVQPIVESLLKAVDGSTNLLTRAKRLGRVLSEESPTLYPVDLKEVIRDSLSLIKMSFPAYAISWNEKYPPKLSSILVRADDFLGEVFTNIFSNSVVYSRENKAQIEIDVEEAQHGNLSMIETTGPSSSLQPYWIISISDHGKGIPDDVKPRLFSRYLQSAKGSGLGMSIVHALITERFKGTVRVLNRIADDYSKGTTVEIWLPKA
jgi:two-component system, OmpR family, sensor histidine kinase VicK